MDEADFVNFCAKVGRFYDLFQRRKTFFFFPRTLLWAIVLWGYSGRWSTPGTFSLNAGQQVQSFSLLKLFDQNDLIKPVFQECSFSRRNLQKVCSQLHKLSHLIWSLFPNWVGWRTWQLVRYRAFRVSNILNALHHVFFKRPVLGRPQWHKLPECSLPLTCGGRKWSEL